VATDKPAPAAAAGSPRGVYVGRAAGTHAFVAVVVGHGQARAYLCDSRHLAVWFPAGTVRQGRVGLRSQGMRLDIRLAGSGLLGQVMLANGSVHGFDAVHASGAAGLYRAVKTFSGHRYVAGWILLRGGAQRGEVVKLNININTADDTLAAPTLNPDAASVELPGAGTASVVKLGDSFVSKTTTG
jgi:hypothetical protein